VACPSCAADVDELDRSTHPYLVSSPGCWAAFGVLQARELQEWGYPPVHGVAVDAYAASHGGDGRERRDRQSVLIHLAALAAVLEDGASPRERVALLQRLTTPKRDFPRLTRPPGFPALDLLHAAAATDLPDYEVRVREWAEAVWAFWSPAHPTVRAYL
jgi:hypothetical protein